MAHGFLTPTPVSGDNFWKNVEWLWKKLSKEKEEEEKKEKGGGLATTQKADIYDPSVKAVRVTDVGSPRAQKNQSVAPAIKMLKQSAVAGSLKPGVDSIVKKEQLALPPGGQRLPGRAAPSKGGTFTNIPGISSAPKKLDSEVFFKAAQTGVHPETGEYLSPEQRKDYLKKSKAKMNATASVASAAAGGIASASSLVTKGDEAVVGSVDNLTKIVTSLVDAVKAQTATQKQISAKESAKADTIASRAKAAAEEKSISAGTDNSGFITPSGGVNLAKLGGGAIQGGMGSGGGPGFGVGGKVAANVIAKRGVGRMAGRAGARIAGKQGAKLGGKIAGKLGLKAAGIAGKKIPLLGLGLGGLFAVQRAMRGDWSGAGMELASGAASTLPGLGTAASLGIDAALLAKDAASGFAGGGLITGGKRSVVDDVPIRADEGEVVMSNAAGNTFGRSTLLAMNAMGGGSNKPSGGKGYAEGGLVGGDKAKSKQMFRLFGEGMIDAQKANSRDFARIQSQGLKQYYQNEGGGDQLGKSLVKIFSKVGGVLGSLFSGTLTSLLGGSAKAAEPTNPADYLADPSVGGSEKEYLMRLMIAEAGGEGDIGMAGVARSVLNRAGLIQSGKVGAGTFNAASGSIMDVINASGQFQPVAEGKLKRNLSPEERKRAAAALEIAMNQADMRGRLEAKGLKADQINKLMAATGFRTGGAFNDASQNVNVTKLGNHYFNTAGNRGLLTPGSVKMQEGPVGGSGASALAAAASSMKGMSSRSGPRGGREACVWAVNKVFQKAGMTPPWGTAEYVPTAEEMMIKAGYQQVSSPQPGDLYIAPGQKHVGIITPDGKVISNSSSGANFSWVDTISGYNSYYGGTGKLYRMPGGNPSSASKRNNKPPSTVAKPPAKNADISAIFQPANANNGTGMMATSAQVSMGSMGLNAGGGNVINNIYNGGGQQSNPIGNGLSAGVSSGGVGLSWMTLRRR